MDDSGVGPFMLLIVAFFYFIPTVVARSRGRDGIGMIFLLNLVIGWTVLGWVVMLIVAFTGPNRSERERIEEQTKLLRGMSEKGGQ